MKNTIVLTIGILLSFWAHSQSNLSFCTFVNNPTQECIFDNVKFITSPDSTHAKLFMMLKSSEVFATNKLIFKLYAIDRFGKEVYINTIVQEVQIDWMNAWQPAIFNSPGKYMVKVYKDEEHMITSKGFEFFNY